MGTSWAELISDSAMVYIDDLRLQEQAATSPAQFFRRMSLLVKAAIPQFNRPAQIVQYLRSGLVYPSYGDALWTSTEESTSQETQVETGCIGYEVFSCVSREMDPSGNISLTAYPAASYDKETGVVTFPIQTAAGIEYMLDFYTDGTFQEDLTPAQMRILGLCVALVWDERFARNWLNIQAKIHDKNFNTVSESNYMTASTSRLEKNQRLLSEALWKYEQDCAYLNTVSKNRGTDPKFV